MIKTNESWIVWLISPKGVLLLVSLSYFWLLFDTSFNRQHVTSDLAWLGAVCILLGMWVVRYRFAMVVVTQAFVDRVLTVVLMCLSVLASFLFLVTGGSINALVDERFSIPAYGLVYGLYFVCALTVGATWRQQSKSIRLIIFFLLYGFVGFIAGGKGFLLPFVFGLSLGQLLGINQISYRWFFIVIAVFFCSATYVVYTLVDNFDAVLVILQTRLALAADAVLWLSQMQPNEILEFPISSWQILVDLFSRWIGIRATPAAVGSVVAQIVSGDEGGGGPNPLLPVMAYLVNRGDFLLAIAFVVVMLAMLSVFLYVVGKWLLKSPEGAFFHAALVFLSPLFIIDVFLYWQSVVCLAVLGSLCLFLKWFSRNLHTTTVNLSSQS